MGILLLKSIESSLCVCVGVDVGVGVHVCVCKLVSVCICVCACYVCVVHNVYVVCVWWSLCFVLFAVWADIRILLLQTTSYPV